MTEKNEQPGHTENSLEGSFNGLAVQADTIHGGVHYTTHVPVPSVWVQLLGGWMIQGEFVGLPLNAGSEKMEILNRPNKVPGLVVQAVNDGLVPVNIDRVSVQFARTEKDTPQEFSLPLRIPGAPDLPRHRLDGQASASWPVELNIFNSFIMATLGSAPSADLPIRAQIRTGSAKCVHGIWDCYGTIPA